MVLINRAFSVQLTPPRPATTISISSRPIFRVMMEFSNYHPSARQHPEFCNILRRNVSLSFLAAGYCNRISSRGAFLVNLGAGKYPDMKMDLDLDLNSVPGLQHEQAWNGEASFHFDLDDAVNCTEVGRKEAERRRKIGLANKGRVPWNKGRQHSAETRARIRQRTIEALRDPKVRRKMSEAPRKLSDQVKAKISISQRRIWGERLKWKRTRENFIMAWAEYIAQAAKEGGIDEEELYWDSYVLMKREMDFQIAKHAEEKAKAIEMKRLQAQKAAQARAEKKVLLALWKTSSKEREERAKRKRKKQEMPKEVKEEFHMKSWLTKIHRKISINAQISSQMPVMLSQHFSLERLNLHVVEMEKLRKNVSLADEIRAAKSKRTESKANVALTALVHPED